MEDDNLEISDEKELKILHTITIQKLSGTPLTIHRNGS